MALYVGGLAVEICPVYEADLGVDIEGGRFPRRMLLFFSHHFGISLHDRMS